MSWSNYWSALGSRQRLGLSVGATAIVAVSAGAAAWLLRDPYVTLQSPLGADALVQQLERAKLDYRMDPLAQRISVPQSQLGKARAAAGVQGDVPPSVGLELFKESDFSSTDFVQRIHYQRALQGELTRTIQAMHGVRSARVHLILAESGVFKRNSTKASAAVSVALLPDQSLTRAQVSGIQRLVVASVPQIELQDVVVLDESGTSLTPRADDAVQSHSQLDLKRQADQYLEGKVLRMLHELVPEGEVSLSIDTTLDYQQLRITTEEPIALPEAGGRVLVKEQDWQRSSVAGLAPVADVAREVAPRTRIGHRLQQVQSAPGTIKRVSVAVALLGAPPELSAEQVERLVSHAIGIDSGRGDAVAVLLLPRTPVPVKLGASTPAPAQRPPVSAARMQDTPWPATPATIASLGAAGIVLLLLWWRAQRRVAAMPVADAERIAATTTKVREWLNQGVANGGT